jgi:hypothetical protein
MKREEFLKDIVAMRAVAATLPIKEYNQVVRRLENDSDDLFTLAISALATEAMFNTARAAGIPALTLNKFLLHPTILNEMSFALSLDDLTTEEVDALLSKKASEIQSVFDRAAQYRAKILERISGATDQLFNTIILRLAALMLANMKNLDEDWDITATNISLLDNKKKLPN